MKILLDEGVQSIVLGSISKTTGIPRSTFYRHWPEIAQMRNHALRRAAILPKPTTPTGGPPCTDITGTIGALMSALNYSAWGQVAPQVIATTATEEEIRNVINDLMQNRIKWVESIFTAAQRSGEIPLDTPIKNMVEIAIAVPYFRRLIAGLPLNQQWLVSHVDFICRIAGAVRDKNKSDFAVGSAKQRLTCFERTEFLPTTQTLLKSSANVRFPSKFVKIKPAPKRVRHSNRARVLT